MVKKTIMIRNRKHHYYDTYGSYDNAINVALKLRKKTKCKYFIIKEKEVGGFLDDILPTHNYNLYTSKKINNE